MCIIIINCRPLFLGMWDSGHLVNSETIVNERAIIKDRHDCLYIKQAVFWVIDHEFYSTYKSLFEAVFTDLFIVFSKLGL